MPFSDTPATFNTHQATPHTQAALDIVQTLFKGFAGGFSLRLWNQQSYRIGAGPSAFTLVLHDPLLLRALVIARHPPLLLADAYFRGKIDVEGDLYSALALKGYFHSLCLPWQKKWRLLWAAWQLGSAKISHKAHALPALVQRFTKAHTRQSDQAAIRFHYDVSNAFYGLWLDSHRVYSCAYFQNPGDSLQRAQENKLELICRKLRLQPGEHLLDIGCGWGALVCWAAQHHGVHAHGITLSHAQHSYAQKRIQTLGLEDRVTVALQDYRDLKGNQLYDKVASIGMFEHVGLKNMPEYLGKVHQVLRPGGLFLNHGITHDEEGWNQTVDTEFINRYVFPDGELDCVSNIQLGMERAGFEIQDVEALRRHYALTLRHWVQRLEAQKEAAVREVGEHSYRIWQLYMAGCALEFEAGGTGIYQILASHRAGAPKLPLTRQDLYHPAGKPAQAVLSRPY
jgi:cyclopropane-fatty-acyl-phospholipid synthase